MIVAPMVLVGCGVNPSEVNDSRSRPSRQSLSAPCGDFTSRGADRTKYYALDGFHSWFLGAPTNDRNAHAASRTEDASTTSARWINLLDARDRCAQSARAHQGEVGTEGLGDRPARISGHGRDRTVMGAGRKQPLRGGSIYWLQDTSEAIEVSWSHP